MFDVLKYTQKFPSPWFNAMSSLEKLCQAVVARNEQVNSCNQHWIKGQGVWFSQILSLMISKSKKTKTKTKKNEREREREKGFLKVQKSTFCKSGLSLRKDYIGMFVS